MNHSLTLEHPAEYFPGDKQTFSGFLFGLNAWWWFLGLVAAYIGIILLRNTFVITPDVLYRGLEDRWTAQRIEEFLELRSERWWLPLISPFIILPVKVTFTALCLTIGTILIEQEIGFKNIFKIALLAESVFIAQMALQVLCGIFLLDVRIPDDYANFAPLSLLQFFDPAALKLWMKHPLRTVNLFEVAYCFVLTYFLAPQLRKYSFGKTVRLVAASYGLGLLLWVVALAFLLLQVS